MSDAGDIYIQLKRVKDACDAGHPSTVLEHHFVCRSGGREGRQSCHTGSPGLYLWNVSDVISNMPHQYSCLARQGGGGGRGERENESERESERARGRSAQICSHVTADTLHVLVQFKRRGVAMLDVPRFGRAAEVAGRPISSVVKSEIVKNIQFVKVVNVVFKGTGVACRQARDGP